jgi:hypothetical protein
VAVAHCPDASDRIGPLACAERYKAVEADSDGATPS